MSLLHEYNRCVQKALHDFEPHQVRAVRLAQTAEQFNLAGRLSTKMPGHCRSNLLALHEQSFDSIQALYLSYAALTVPYELPGGLRCCAWAGPILVASQDEVNII